MHQIICRLGLCPRPTGGAYIAPPDPTAGLGVGPRGTRRREGRGGRGTDGKGGEGVPECPNPELASLTRTRINITVCVSIMSIISCCSKIQNELAFWYRGLPRLSWQLAFKRMNSSTNKYNVRAYYVFGSELNWYFGKRCTFRLIAWSELTTQPQPQRTECSRQPISLLITINKNNIYKVPLN